MIDTATVRPVWTVAEVERLRDLLSQGWTDDEIAGDLGRTAKAVNRKRYHLGLRAPRQPGRPFGTARPEAADVHVVGQRRDGKRSVLTTFTGPEAQVRAEAWARLAAPQLEAYCCLSVEPGGKAEVLRVACGRGAT